MGKDEDEAINVIGGTAILLGAAWLLGKFLQNKPITRCPNCQLVVKEGIANCPRCGTWLNWPTQNQTF
ncbi:MAG: hypothetical protein WCE94_13860 [Candidatus Methanoperedens sp.]